MQDMHTPSSPERIAHALSDPLRMRILEALAAGRQDPTWSPDIPELPTAICALDLQHRLGDIAASKMSYHMRELREAGLVREYKHGKWIYYLLNQDVLDTFLQQLRQRFLEGTDA